MPNPQVIFNPVTEQIEFDATSELNVNHKVVFNLGTVNDSAWKLRYRLTINNSGFIASGRVRLWMGLTNADESVAEGVAQNAIFFFLLQDVAANLFQLRTADNEGLDGSGGPSQNLTTLALPSTYYVELERVSFTVGNDTVIVRLYDNPDYLGTPLEEQSIELVNSREIEGLKYFFVQTDDNANSSSQGATGTIDQIQFWNNTKQVRQRIPDFVDNLDDTTKWTKVDDEPASGGTIDVDLASAPKQIFFNSLNDSQDERVFRKLPFVLSDEKWVLEFEADILGTSIPGHFLLGFVGNTNNPVDPSPFLNEVPFIALISTDAGTPDNNNDVSMFIAEGDGQQAQRTLGNNANIAIPPVKLYIRFIRVSKTTIRLETYDDPEMTILHDTPREGTTTAAGILVENITNLSFLNAGTLAVGGAPRDLTATIQNIRIYNGNNHLDLARINAGAIPDFLEGFNYFTQADADNAWPSINVVQSRVNITTEELDFKADTATNQEGTIVHDLQKELGKGVFMDDNKWLVRFKLNWSVLNFVSAGVNHNFGLTAFDETVNSEDIDIFAMMTYIHALVGNSNLGSSSGANALIPAGLPSDTTIIKQLAVATDFFFEIARTSKTTGYVRQYADSSYKNILEEFPFTNLSKSVSGLRFFKFTAKARSSGGGSTGILDDLEIWNGTNIPNEADKIRVKLEDCDTPGIATGNKIHWTAKSTGQVTHAKAQLWEEDVLIAESQFLDLTPDYREYEFELTVAEVNSVTDWDKLSITIVPDTVE